MSLSSRIQFASLIVAALALGASAAATPSAEMVRIEGGAFRPLFGEKAPINVERFYLDVHPVTNEDFLAFVQANPRWRRSQIIELFADAAYLKTWRGDLDPGFDELGPDTPVTNVSWFAARAYADWAGKRLPTTLEWEYAAAASEDDPDGSNDPGFHQRILGWYSRSGKKPPAVGEGFRNYWGVWNMHGAIWEWTEDFNSSFVTGESRADSDLDRKLFCGSGAAGASDFKDYVAFMRYAMRSSLEAEYTVSRLGFRCAASAPLTDTLPSTGEQEPGE